MSDWLNHLFFRPGLLGLLGNPFYINRSAIYKFLIGHRRRLTGRLMDVGCGSQPYRHLFTDVKYVGLEYDTPHARERNVADRYYRDTAFPAEDGEFDVVLATEVIEHVFESEAFLKEIHRCLRPGGSLILTAPFLWDEHEQPYDFARYTSFGLRHLLTKNGFELLEETKLNVGFVAYIQLLNNYIYKRFNVKRRKYRFLIVAVLCAPMNIIGAAMRCLGPGVPDAYTNNAIVAVRRSE